MSPDPNVPLLYIWSVDRLGKHSAVYFAEAVIFPKPLFKKKLETPAKLLHLQIRVLFLQVSSFSYRSGILQNTYRCQCCMYHSVIQHESDSFEPLPCTSFNGLLPHAFSVKQTFISY